MGTRRVLLAGLALGGWLVSGEAYSYCRTNTCDADPENPNCRETADECLEGGAELFWDRNCLSFSIHQAGSAKRQISYAEAERTISEAMNRWTQVECPGGGRPAMAVELTEPVTCEEIAFNRSGPNANTWIFRDDEWPYATEGDAALTLALTTVTFNADTGEILDADVEMNSAGNELTANDESDLAAVATHEAGHIYGLAHSMDNEATMWAYYSAQMASTTELSDDDAAGMCAIYAPGTEAASCNFAPEGGFTAGCYEPEDTGCSVSRPGGSSRFFHGTVILAAAAALIGWTRRRRR